MLCMAATAALLSGCKGNTTAADPGGNAPLGPPPTIRAGVVAAGIAQADPLTNLLWQKVEWTALAPCRLCRPFHPGHVDGNPA